MVPGVEGPVGAVPPPAAAPKSETEAKIRAAESRGFFMTPRNYATLAAKKITKYYLLSRLMIHRLKRIKTLRAR